MMMKSISVEHATISVRSVIHNITGIGISKSYERGRRNHQTDDLIELNVSPLKQANNISNEGIVAHSIKLVSDNGVPSDMIHEALIAENINSNSTYLFSQQSLHLFQTTSHPTSHPNSTPTNELQPDLTYVFDDFLFLVDGTLTTTKLAM